jgi:hypothetical protein
MIGEYYSLALFYDSWVNREEKLDVRSKKRQQRSKVI